MRAAAIATATALLLVLVLGTIARADAALVIQPEEIPIDLWFHGGRVRATAAHAGADHVVFRLLGPEHDLRLKVKGRIGGILWANVGEVRFEHVPSVLLLRGGPDLLPGPVLDREGLSPWSLRGRILGEEPDATAELAFDEMLSLLRDQGAYATEPGATLGPDGAAATEFELPAEVPTGTYDLSVTFFAGDRPIGTEHATLQVRRGGAVAAIGDLARNRPLTYGMIAIVVAVLAGLATGFVFGLGRKRKR